MSAYFTIIMPVPGAMPVMQGSMLCEMKVPRGWLRACRSRIRPMLVLVSKQSGGRGGWKEATTSAMRPPEMAYEQGRPVSCLALAALAQRTAEASGPTHYAFSHNKVVAKLRQYFRSSLDW